MTARTTIAIAAMLLTASLGACSRSPDETPPQENSAETTVPAEPVAVEMPDAPDPRPSASATPAANVTAEAPPAVPPAPDEQMMDDASATGMTARTSRDEAPSNEAVPVEQVERK
jgi:hypothetical protein